MTKARTRRQDDTPNAGGRLKKRNQYAPKRKVRGTAVHSNTMTIDDEPHNFEPWSSDEGDTSADTPSPTYHIKQKCGL
ncbi:hypothetical protein TNCV_1176831 [Trichonephila clavipes]|nr:hypothetical protein TNCV_1176831 [Trichonephila clavipes]